MRVSAKEAERGTAAYTPLPARIYLRSSMEEHQPTKLKVVGSNPTGGAEVDRSVDDGYSQRYAVRTLCSVRSTFYGM